MTIFNGGIGRLMVSISFEILLIGVWCSRCGHRPKTNYVREDPIGMLKEAKKRLVLRTQTKENIRRW